MKSFLSLPASGVAVCMAGIFCLRSDAQTVVVPGVQRPNVIFILCDDLGYGDVGVFYQNSRPPGEASFQTPNIDALAREGVMLTEHYSAAPVCAPARASLMTGRDQGNAHVRDNHFDEPIGPGPTLGSVMQAAGYYTGAIGKWGLGGKKPPFEAHPLDRGFDEFYGFMRHVDAHEHYPGNRGTIFDGREPVRSGIEGLYSTDLFTARAKKFITDHVAAKPGQPFFLYLAYTAPHVLLEAPPGPYPDGGGLHGGVQWPLEAGSGQKDSYIFPDYARTSWSPAAKRYATMIRRIDSGVSDLRRLLSDLQIEKNTVIIFTSDNGPANEADGGRYSADPRYFGSAGPLDGIKRDLWDGGFREPTIVCAPGLVPGGRTVAAPSAFWDWMPTLARLGGVVPPASTDGLSLLPMLEGKGGASVHDRFYFEYYYDGSFAVDGGPEGLFARKDVTGRQQMQAIRIGDFMGVRYQVKSADTPLRLYEVVHDPHEDNDVASQPEHAGLLRQMYDGLLQSHVANPLDPRPYDQALVPAVMAQTIPGVDFASYTGRWPWLPDFTQLSATSHSLVPSPTAAPSPPAPEYGLYFTGYLNAPTDGDYVLYLAADSEALLRVHDMIEIDDTSMPAARNVEKTGLMHLKAGLHPFQLYYRHTGGGPKNLTFDWSGPDFARRPLKAGDLQADKTAADRSATP